MNSRRSKEPDAGYDCMSNLMLFYDRLSEKAATLLLFNVCVKPRE